MAAAYAALRNTELEPYSGSELWLRSAICSVAYLFLWGVFVYVSGVMLTGELWQWIVIAGGLCAVGAVFPSALFDLDYGNGFFHYMFYLFISIFLRYLAGMGWIWDMAPAT